MAEIPKHARYATQALFDSAVSAGSVPSGAVCFIEDTRQIYVNGNYYTMDDAEIEEKVTAALGDYYTKDEVANLIGDLDQEVKDVVSDVSGLKTEVAGKADAFDVGYGLSLEDGVLKVTLDTSLFVVVKELPTEPTAEDEGKLHLVPMGETEEGNEYAEYLWVNGAWELMGTLHTKVDLSGYLPLTGGTLTGDLKVDAKFYLKENENGERAYVLSCNDDGEVVMTLWSELEEKWLSGSKKRTLYGDMMLNGNMDVEGNLYGDASIATDGDLSVHGDTTLYLPENADAPNVVVADDEGTLYKVPKSEVGGGGDYLPLTGGTLTGDLNVGGDLEVNGGELKVETGASYFAGGTYIDTSGHIHLPSGVEIY